MKHPGVVTQALLLFVVVLAVYYPAITVPLNPIDDRALVQWLHDTSGSSLWPLFTYARDVFYRPVLLTTFFADMWLWGAEASFMHLENILLHALNAVLLFACARIAFVRALPGQRWAAFAAALLFAIHPINTEAVIWVSGRSDLLACSFMLGSFLLLLQALETDRPSFAWLALLLLIPGFLAKETAVFFVPAALIFIVFTPAHPPSSSRGGQILSRWAIALPFLFVPLGYLCVRGILVHDAGVNFVRHFFVDTGAGIFEKGLTVLAGLGFYAKKLVFPWPLNFTIFHVPTYYSAIGVMVLSFLAYCAVRRDLTGGLFLSCAAVASSALLAMIMRPAWTPVAERYLYLPATFFALAAVLAVARVASRYLLRRGVVALMVLFYTGTALATVERTMLWQDNLALFEDVVRKSPDFPFARSTLADLLREAGRGEESSVIIRENVAPRGLRNADFLDLKRAELLMSEGRYLEARKLILETRRKEGQLYYEFQKLLVSVDLKLLQGLSGEERQGLRTEVVMLFEELARVTGDPFYHYRLGQFYLQEGERISAGRCFRLAAQGAPAGAVYKAAAARLAGKLAP